MDENSPRFARYLELVIHLKEKEKQFPPEERWRIHEEYEAVKQAYREGKIDWLGGSKFIRT